MNLSCSSQMIKYLMFGFNLLFVLSGIIIIAVGAAVKTVYTEYAEFLDTKYFSLPNMLIATGSLIFFISFFGCCGAIKESWIMLAVFSLFLIMIFIFEFASGIAGYVLRDRTVDFLDSTLRNNLDHYNNTHAIWDLIQGTFECCGVDSYNDWRGKLKEPFDLPLSCCPTVSGTVAVFYCNSYSSGATITTKAEESSATTTAPNVTTENPNPTTGADTTASITSTTGSPSTTDAGTTAFIISTTNSTSTTNAGTTASNSNTSTTIPASTTNAGTTASATTTAPNVTTENPNPTTGADTTASITSTTGSPSTTDAGTTASIISTTNSTSTTNTGTTASNSNTSTTIPASTTNAGTTASNTSTTNSSTTSDAGSTAPTSSTHKPVPFAFKDSNPNGERLKRAVVDAESESTTSRAASPSGPSTSSPYPRGCKTAFGAYIKKHAVQIGGCALGLAIVQIAGIAFSCHLVRQLKNGYYST